MSKKKSHHHQHHSPSPALHKPNASANDSKQMRNFLIGFFIVTILLVVVLYFAFVR